MPRRLDLSVTGEKGDPLQAIYVEYKSYEYEVDDSFIVKYAGEGNYTERPILTFSLDQTQTGVEKVIITASDRGRITSKTINVTNIKEEGIDLTGLVTGEDPGHEHVYVNSFDDTSHYEECMICGLKRNIVAHTITRKMVIEDAAVCDPSNSYIDSCTCGYYTQGHVEHTTDNQWHTTIGTMKHFTLCSVCQNWPQSERCITADGQVIDCNHPGTCSVCGYVYTKQSVPIINI